MKCLEHGKNKIKIKCPVCNKKKIKIEEKYRQEEKILIEYCTNCNYSNIDHLHDSIRLKK
jgi:C4-type Zn-finger protein